MLMPAGATLLHICSIPEDQSPSAMMMPELFGVGGVRDAVMRIWGVLQLADSLHRNSIRGERSRAWTHLTLRSWVSYGVKVWVRKRRVEMDIPALVASWIPIIRGLSTAHSKDEIDRCEFEAETHLQPLLAAPVKQLREFYAQLCAALRNDPTIPMFVWTAFDAWHEVIVKRAPDEDVRELKTKLAAEVADLVEGDVLPDIKTALVAALQWRSPEVLAEVKQAVSAGAKPRVRGRESCLFLVVPRLDGTELTVML
jgi:hypothetical protein